MATTQPRSASRYYATSALLAQQAASRALAIRPQGAVAVARTIAAHQISQAVLAERAVAQMLSDQDVDIAAEALLNSPAFATSLDNLLAEIDRAATDFEFTRMVTAITQDSGRAAQSVAIAARPRIQWVRRLTLPSCSRCAVLAGRVYRYSEGFLRHPGCDCVMVPVTVGSDAPYDIDDLVRTGQVTGLSKADQQALVDGADFNQIVNVRHKEAGLRESGRVLYRAGRMTPEAIYRQAGDDRPSALALLKANGYIR